jgi:hypothetical protein
MGAKPQLSKETDCETSDRNSAAVSRSSPAQDERPAIVLDEEDFVKKMYLRRLASPRIIINKNGSRFISPLEIVRSDAGRAEIARQRRPSSSSEKADSETSKKANPQRMNIRDETDR